MLYESVYTKNIINHSINLLTKNASYTACGLWVDYPKNWRTIGEIGSDVELYRFNKKTI